ncbi:MAG: transporter substrate-binding domain-containing protein [Acidobacteria bacterium]|nr:transporter substrate-binding domain-containing protein [Acidobacteriota bacterium]
MSIAFGGAVRTFSCLLAVAAASIAFEPLRAEDIAVADCERVLPLDLRKICKRGELRVVRYEGERPPFFSLKGDATVGFDVDLGRDMAERMGVRYREVAAAESFDAVVDRVADGSADLGLSKLSATLARAQRVRFSRPYLTVYQALLVNRLSAPGGGDPFQGFERARLHGRCPRWHRLRRLCPG